MSFNFYKAMSLLLEYPTQELHANLDDLAKAVSQEADMQDEERSAVLDLIAFMRQSDLIELQAEYVKTFDLVAEHSLHLTHHLFGDDKNRGPALIDLTEMYKEYGLDQSTNELPDYLPLILEFASQLEDSEARVFLADTSKILKVLADNLDKVSSPWATGIRLIEKRGSLLALAA
jgi:nitrate reductase delta subunit